MVIATILLAILWLIIGVIFGMIFTSYVIGFWATTDEAGFNKWLQKQKDKINNQL